MKKMRYSEHQIIKVLKEVEGGRNVKDICREYIISEATYYNWNSKYGGMESSDIKRLKELGMDNGPEFISSTLAGWAEERDIQLDFIQPAKPTQNSYIERFNRTFRDEVLNRYVFNSLFEVRARTESWMNEYDEERPHDSLGDITPRKYGMAHQQRGNSN